MARSLPFPPPEPDNLPIPDWHLQLVEERLAAHRAHPEQVVTWEEAEQEILSQLRNR
ncbi:MAG TPA: addiction module protein [Thermoanaerobaculia bacterium]|nr:addiction module protein [Thermoanaerobaculia bacterium]